MEEDEKLTQQPGEELDASKEATEPIQEDAGNEPQVEETAAASDQTNEAEEPMAEQGGQGEQPNDDLAAAFTDEDVSEDEQPEATAPAQTAEPAKVVCPKCGAENDAAAAYCPKCGAKLEGAAKAEPKEKQGEQPAPSISLDDLAALQESEKPQKTDAKAWLAKNKIVAAIAAAVVVVLAVLVVPPMLATPDDLFEQGKYEQAYQKSADEDKPAMLARICGAGEFQTAYDLAPDDDAKYDVIVSAVSAGDFEAAYSLPNDDKTKEDILVANIIAEKCGGIIDSMRDPDSFMLVSAHFSDVGAFYLEVSGRNTFGSMVSNYYVCTLNDSKTDFREPYHLLDLDMETVYSFDSYSSAKEKRTNNSARGLVEALSSSEFQVNPRLVSAINAIVDNGGIHSVSLLPDVSKIYAKGMNS